MRLSFLLIFTLYSLLNALNIQLQPSVKMNKKTITLADITKSHDEKETFEVIKKMPIATLQEKENLNITGIDVQIKLLNDFGLVAKVKGFSSVIYQSKKISADYFISEIENFIKMQKNIKSKVEVSLATTPSIEINSESYDLQLEIARETKSSASITFRATILENHQIEKRFPLIAEIYAYKKIAVSRQTIRRDVPVNDTNIDFITKRIPLNADVITEKLMKNNMVASRMIPKGKILKSHHLKIPDAVRRNDTIKVYVKSGLLTLTFQGVAKENGKIGDIIEIENASSNEIFNAKIIANKTAQIALGGF